MENNVVPFPTKRMTATGVVRQSTVIGKMPDGTLVHVDEITGLPIVYNEKRVPYFVDRTETGFAYPKDYDYKEVPKELWAVYNKQTMFALTLHNDRESAYVEARKQRRWNKIDAVVIPI